MNDQSTTPITDEASKAFSDHVQNPPASANGSLSVNSPEVVKWIKTAPADGWETARRIEITLSSRVKDLEQALKWYVDTDETNEGIANHGTNEEIDWNVENKEFIDGKRRTQKLLGLLE